MEIVVTIAVIAAFLFIVSRNFFTWYWKLNKIVQRLVSIDIKLAH